MCFRNGRQDEAEVKETTPQTTTTTMKEESTDDKQLDATAVDENNNEDESNPEESTEIEEEEEEDDDNDNEVDHTDNLDRCHKCAKPSFKFKKEFYCSKCVQQGVIKAEEEKPVHCRKCRKVSYRAKNGDFCEALCSVETAMEPIEGEATMDDATTEEENMTTTEEPQLGLLGNIIKLILGGAEPQQDTTEAE